MQKRSLYVALLIMFVIMLIAGYYLMTVLITRNITANINKIYVVGLMALAGVLAQIAIMHRPFNGLDVVLMGASAVIIVTLILMVRAQKLVRDTQFLKSMIEHHEMAVVMAGKILEKTKRADVGALASSIIRSQSCEIALMREMLKRAVGTAILQCSPHLMGAHAPLGGNVL